MCMCIWISGYRHNNTRGYVYAGTYNEFEGTNLVEHLHLNLPPKPEKKAMKLSDFNRLVNTNETLDHRERERENQP